MNYKEAGVNIEEGYRAVNKYKEFAASTASTSVLNEIGSFAGMFSAISFAMLHSRAKTSACSRTVTVQTKPSLAGQSRGRWQSARFDGNRPVSMVIGPFRWQSARSPNALPQRRIAIRPYVGTIGLLRFGEAFLCCCAFSVGGDKIIS